jgi:hypothetical protein
MSSGGLGIERHIASFLNNDHRWNSKSVYQGEFVEDVGPVWVGDLGCEIEE